MATQGRIFKGRSEGAERADGAFASGVVVIAAVFMSISGTFQVVQGLAGVIDRDFFAAQQNYAYDIGIATWGWLHLIVGLFVMMTGFALLTGSLWGRIFALFIVIVAGLINFIFIPYSPIWSIIMLSLNGLVVWALLSSGPELDEV